VTLSTPRVMGILNVGPDSFFDGGKFMERRTMLRHAGRMLDAGASFIDLGAVSSRPGARPVSERTERGRLMPALRALVKAFPDALVSVDTFRAAIAHEALSEGAAIVNDITAGTADRDMLPTAARHRAPVVLMHMKGDPRTMQRNPRYRDVAGEVTAWLQRRIAGARRAGVHDVIVDPGFGFGKTLDHNYTLLRNLPRLRILDAPVLAGLSRKSMVNKVLGTVPADALNGTTALHVIALLNGAHILRVHDVRPAVEAVALTGRYAGR